MFGDGYFSRWGCVLLPRIFGEKGWVGWKINDSVSAVGSLFYILGRYSARWVAVLHIASCVAQGRHLVNASREHGTSRFRAVGSWIYTVWVQI